MLTTAASVGLEASRSRFPIGPLLSASDEITRVRQHFLGAILEVGARPTTGQSAAQRKRRAKLLTRLIRYAVAGRFPKNVSRPGRLAPTFVDHEGTRCAVAFLMEGAGAGVLVDRIVGTANHAYVPELALDAVVRDWLLAQGVSVEEATRIQPSYCYTPASCVCNHISGSDLQDLLAGTVSDGGTRFVVDAVFRTENGVNVGDVIDTVYDDASFDGKRVLATGSNGGISVWLTYEFVDDSTVDVAPCFGQFALAPQRLELAVVLDIANGAECLETLEDLNSGWTEEQGTGCDDGCSFSALPAREAGLLYALIAGLAIVRRRRTRS